MVECGPPKQAGFAAGLSTTAIARCKTDLPGRRSQEIMLSPVLALATLLASTSPAQPGVTTPKPTLPDIAVIDARTRAAIEAVAFDYVDGQLEGDAGRVARALHPDLAKRAVAGPGPTSREVFPLRRMSADELIGLTQQGALKTPRERWDRSVRVLDVTGNAAVVRVETPWFVDYFHMGRFGERWLIVNALWFSKPGPGSTTPGR